MKRTLAFILAFVSAFMLAGCSNRQEKAKSDIFNLVEKNYDEIIAACEDKDADALLAIDGITQVKIVDGYVLVYCKGAGIAPSSQDYGFYYTEENIPVGVGCNLDIVCYRDTMQPKGSGYEGTVNYNTFYTEHIKGNIYFYSNAY
jgi:hypothetical protein